jgi:hypothetical protein
MKLGGISKLLGSFCGSHSMLKEGMYGLFEKGFSAAGEF